MPVLSVGLWKRLGRLTRKIGDTTNQTGLKNRKSVIVLRNWGLTPLRFLFLPPSGTKWVEVRNFCVGNCLGNYQKNSFHYFMVWNVGLTFILTSEYLSSGFLSFNSPFFAVDIASSTRSMLLISEGFRNNEKNANEMPVLLGNNPLHCFFQLVYLVEVIRC